MTAVLRALGLDETTARQLTEASELPYLGRVARVDKGLGTVLTAEGPVRASWSGAVLAAIAADPQAVPCTGDWVALRHWPDERITVERIAPRRTAVIRADARGTSRGQVLAANIDVAAVVAGLEAEPNIRRIERLLALAWASGARPVVILTKADLVDDAEDVATDVAEAAPGVEVLVCSATTGAGIPALRALLAENRTVALLGVSGAGKSSLVNTLAGTDVLSVQAIRSDGRGRHTSVRRELVPIPGGGVVIDTPGLRSVGLQESPEAAFPDIAALTAQCRFGNCMHGSEPGCAVQAALEDGSLPWRRYESWLQLRNEAARMALRTDVRRRREAKRDLIRRTARRPHK